MHIIILTFLEAQKEKEETLAQPAPPTIQDNFIDWKVFILPRVAEFLIHKERQRGCPLLDANIHTDIYFKYIYDLFV